VILAAVGGVALIFMPLPAPSPASLNAALTELLVLLLLRILLPFVAVVLILSLGRQGMDVLYLRAMLTSFLMGAAIVAFILWALFSVPTPVPIELHIPGSSR
jgi:hypothetical protein